MILDRLDLILNESEIVMKNIDSYFCFLSENNKTITLYFENDIKSMLSTIAVKDYISKLGITNINVEPITEKTHMNENEIPILIYTKDDNICIKSSIKKDSIVEHYMDLNGMLLSSDINAINSTKDIDVYGILPEDIDNAISDIDDSKRIRNNKELLVISIERILESNTDPTLIKKIVLNSKATLNSVFDNILLFLN